MSSKDVWYGVLEAGEKTSPVVRDASIEAAQNKIYLYNHVRNDFIEYAQAIVEPKLRELKAGDISKKDLEKAFNTARQAFMAAHKVRSAVSEKRAAAPAKSRNDDDETDFDTADDDTIEEFIDDD